MRRARVLREAIATGLIVLMASPVFAGVVLSETSLAKGPGGEMSQSRTVYVQGNKQRVERGAIDAITDLDKSVVYVIDKDHKSYAELPLQTLRPSTSPNVRTAAIQLTRTGKVRTIANHRCNEYRAVGGDKVESITEDQVLAMANQLFQPELVAVTLLGRLDGVKLTRNQLEC